MILDLGVALVKKLGDVAQEFHNPTHVCVGVCVFVCARSHMCLVGTESKDICSPDKWSTMELWNYLFLSSS